MTHKYERQCWHCNSKNMEKLTNHVKCRDCGATWNFLPKPGVSPIAADFFEAKDTKSGRRESKSKPHAVIARRAAHARSKKS